MGHHNPVRESAGLTKSAFSGVCTFPRDPRACAQGCGAPKNPGRETRRAQSAAWHAPASMATAHDRLVGLRRSLARQFLAKSSPPKNDDELLFTSYSTASLPSTAIRRIIRFQMLHFRNSPTAIFGIRRSTDPLLRDVNHLQAPEATGSRRENLTFLVSVRSVTVAVRKGL